MTNQVKVKRSAVPGKVPALADLNLGELAINTNDGKLFTAKDDGVKTIVEIGAASYQQLNTVGVSVENGYESRADNTISFDDVSRTLYNTPTGASFTIWAGQVPHVNAAPQSVSITDSEGIWYFYYDTDGVLTTTRTFTPYILTLYTFCAEVYWDAMNKKAIFLADERHGRLMPAAVHSYLHSTQHAKWATGLSLTGFSVDGNGDLAANAQFAVTDGKYFDEDIDFNIVNGSPQQLSAFARIPILYMVGTNWRKVAATDYPVAYGLAGTNTRVVYNQKVGNDWQLTEVGNNNFILMHYFGTNDVTTPILAIMGQAEYTTKSAAYSAARSELMSIDARGLPTLEYVPLGSVIFETNNVFNNVPKARIRTTNASNEAYVDWRGTAVTTLISDSLQAAPLSGTYVTMGPEAVLPNERVLTGTANQITVTDGGAGGNVVVAIDNSVLTTLAGKAATVHAHAIADVTGLQSALDNSGTVTSVAVVSANGLAGTVATTTTTPEITLSTTVTGMVKGDGTSLSEAIAGVDYVVPTVGGGVALRQISVAVPPTSGTSNKIDANTAPVVTDGTQIWSQVITPRASSSAFTLDGSFYIDHSTNNRRIVIAIWRMVDAVNTLVGVSSAFITASNNGGEISISFYDTPATASTITYTMRAFSNGSGTWYVGQGSTAVFAGNLGKQIVRLTETA